MNDSTSQRTSPREDTLHFLRMFARLYQPSKDATTDNNEDSYNSLNGVLC